MPSHGAVANRRFLVLLIAAAGLIFFTIALFSNHDTTALDYSTMPIPPVTVQDSTLKGDAIAGKLGNETLKYVDITVASGLSFEKG